MAGGRSLGLPYSDLSVSDELLPQGQLQLYRKDKA